MNRELPDVQAGFRKGRGTRDQIANMHWIMEKGTEFQKNIYFCFIDYAKAFDCVDHNKLWKILKEMGIPDHLTCLFRNLYAGQEATGRTGHRTTDWFQIGKGVCQGCILSPCLFNLYAEYIMRNTGLEEALEKQWKQCQTLSGIKIAGKNINNLRYADDTTLMAESEKELKSLFVKVKEESEKAELKLNIQKKKIMASGPITSWQTDGETVEKVTYFIFLVSKITVDSDCNHEIKRCLLLRRSYDQPRQHVKKQKHYFANKVRVVKAMVFPISSVQFSSVAQSCPTLCDPMNRSTPGLPVHHQLLEFTQTHVHRVGDAIQPSHPLSSPSPPASNPFQHQGLFQ